MMTIQLLELHGIVMLFCHWRTHIMNSFLRSQNQPIADFRLPKTEWNMARGGLECLHIHGEGLTLEI